MKPDLLQVDLQSLLACRDVGSLNRVFASLCESKGYTRLAYGDCLAYGGVEEARKFSRGMSTWWEYYAAEGFESEDPTIPPMYYASLPYFWEDTRKTASPDGVRCLDEAQAAGMTNGLIIPLRSPTECFAVTLAGRPDRPSLSVVGELTYIAVQYHQRHKEFTGLPHEDVSLSLTPRMTQALTYAAQGLTYEAIAEEMGIAIKTVEKHMSEAFRRLDVHKLPHAVAKATTYQLIHVEKIVPFWAG